MRIAILPLLILSAPLAAEPPAPAEQEVPQPVVLDWTGQFRLNAPPNNVEPARLKAAADAVESRHQVAAPREGSSHATAALDVDDRSTTRTSYRRLESDGPTLNLQAPVESGPVSLGARYGNYRVVPDTNGVSAHDLRVSLGVAF
jgi:hypothetical protein